MIHLSEDLLIGFAKSMKTEERRGDVTLFGTVSAVNDDGTATVILDGSEAETKANCATLVKPNDRVTVLMKEHKAIVTGNLVTSLGSIVRASGVSPTSISIWTWTTLCELTLDAGTYVIFGYLYDGPSNVTTLFRLLTWEDDVLVQRQATITGNNAYGANAAIFGICTITSSKTITLLTHNASDIVETASPYHGEIIALRIV